MIVLAAPEASPSQTFGAKAIDFDSRMTALLTAAADGTTVKEEPAIVKKEPENFVQARTADPPKVPAMPDRLSAFKELLEQHGLLKSGRSINRTLPASSLQAKAESDKRSESNISANASVNTSIKCFGNTPPILLRTGEFECPDGLPTLYFNKFCRAFYARVSEFLGLPRAVIFIWSVMFALLAGWFLETFWFRRLRRQAEEKAMKDTGAGVGLFHDKPVKIDKAGQAVLSDTSMAEAGQKHAPISPVEPTRQALPPAPGMPAVASAQPVAAPSAPTASSALAATSPPAAPSKSTASPEPCSSAAGTSAADKTKDRVSVDDLPPRPSFLPAPSPSKEELPVTTKKHAAPHSKPWTLWQLCQKRRPEPRLQFWDGAWTRDV